MNIRETLEGIFRETFEDDTIVLTDDMTAADIEDWDSLAHIELIVASEKAFQVKFTTQEISELKNVGDFIALCGRKLEE